MASEMYDSGVFRDRTLRRSEVVAAQVKWAVRDERKCKSWLVKARFVSRMRSGRRIRDRLARGMYTLVTGVGG